MLADVEDELSRPGKLVSLDRDHNRWSQRYRKECFPEQEGESPE